MLVLDQLKAYRLSKSLEWRAEAFHAAVSKPQAQRPRATAPRVALGLCLCCAAALLLYALTLHGRRPRP